MAGRKIQTAESRSAEEESHVVAAAVAAVVAAAAADAVVAADAADRVGTTYGRGRGQIEFDSLTLISPQHASPAV